MQAWSTPGGLCNSPFYSCEDFCTMQQGDVHGNITLQQSGIITGVENAAVDVANWFGSLVGAQHIDPPPPVV